MDFRACFVPRLLLCFLLSIVITNAKEKVVSKPGQARQAVDDSDDIQSPQFHPGGHGGSGSSSSKCGCTGKREACVRQLASWFECVYDFYCDGRERLLCGRSECVCIGSYMRNRNGDCVSESSCNDDPSPPRPNPSRPNPSPSGSAPWQGSSQGQDNCGRQLARASPGDIARIVGGTNAVPHQFPWQVALTSGGSKPFCGGSLISEDVVVTAAHCVEGQRSVTVILGSHKISERENGEQRIKADKISIHSRYHSRSNANDIALLKLSKKVTLTDTVNTICLPRSEASSGTQCVVTGWGQTSGRRSQPDTLQKVNVPIISDRECNGYYWNIDEPSMICAFRDGRGDACYGDSGGPLACERSGRFELQGAVSWGIGCGTYPGVYAQVASYYDWIQEHLR